MFRMVGKNLLTKSWKLLGKFPQYIGENQHLVEVQVAQLRNWGFRVWGPEPLTPNRYSLTYKLNHKLLKPVQVTRYRM